LLWRGCWLFEVDWWRYENDGDFEHGGSEHECLLWVVMKVLGSRFLDAWWRVITMAFEARLVELRDRE